MDTTYYIMMAKDLMYIHDEYKYLCDVADISTYVNASVNDSVDSIDYSLSVSYNDSLGKFSISDSIYFNNSYFTNTRDGSNYLARNFYHCIYVYYHTYVTMLCMITG